MNKIKFGFLKFLKKKVNILDVFKSKIDFNQYPGKIFWKKNLKKIKNSDHVSNYENRNLGQEIRCEVIKKHLGINKEKIEFVDHHYCHSLYAYFSGPLNLKDSTVITLDAYGDNQNFTCYTYKRKNSTIKINKILSSNKSVIARLYRYNTNSKNKPSQHEYKVMGLAPYAKTYYTEEVYNEFLKIQKFHKLKFTKKKNQRFVFFCI